jgi:DMSO/TMAO reductase YedYZ molybdopterin-dependent catalytic subunit
MAFVSRGFRGKRRDDVSSSRVPPGQHVVGDFPVLSAGPTPRVSRDEWTFTIDGEIDSPKRWTWDEFSFLPSETFTTDIHCVTKWSKLDTSWTGVSMDTILEGVETAAEFTTVYSDGGYTTNLALDDLMGRKAWIVFDYDGQPLHPEHGGPVRLLVPHLYLWKSAKWVRGITLQNEEQAGFWESNGYNMHGDPWREQRYWGD